jgi:hypothetical protein
MIQTEIDSIAGFERRDYYSESDARNLVARHRQLAQEYQVSNPYFDFTGKGEPLYLDLPVDDNVRIKIGRIGAFSAEEIALALNEQVAAYVLRDTMGPDYPKNDLATNEELTALMSGGIDPNRIIVLFEQSTENGMAPIAGVQAFLGGTDVPLKDVLFDESEVTSTLSTLQSLRVVKNDVTVAALEGFLNQYGETPEREVVAMSRLFSRGKSTLENRAIKDKDQAWEAMSLLILGIHMLAVDQNLEMPTLFLYDTHSNFIQTALTQLFNMNVIATPDQLTVTDEVSNTVLAYHYGGPRTVNDLKNSIVVGTATDGDYFGGAAKKMREHGIDMYDLMEGFSNSRSIGSTIAFPLIIIDSIKDSSIGND